VTRYLPPQSPPERRAFLIYYARVMIGEARRRRGTVFARTLLDWAAKARREADAIQPAQRELFASE
jgi:hypothetical protein